MSVNKTLYQVFWLFSLEELIPWQNNLINFFERVGSPNRLANWTQLQFLLKQSNPVIRFCLITTPDYRIMGLMLLKQKQNGWLYPYQLTGLGNNPHITDANDLLIDPEADTKRVAALLANALLQAPFRWSRIHWQFLQEYPSIQVFASTLAPHVENISLTADMPRPTLLLPSTEADYIDQRSRRVRKFVNNKQNRLRREYSFADTSFRWIAPEDTPPIMDWFFPNYLTYWNEQGVKTKFHSNPELISFYRQCLLHGHLKLTGYYVGNELACAFIGYDAPFNTYILHLTTFNKKYVDYSPGILHNDELIKALIEKGYNKLDFGLGDMEYKSYFTPIKLPTWQLKVYRNLFSRILFGGLAPRIKTAFAGGKLSKRLIRKSYNWIFSL